MPDTLASNSRGDGFIITTTVFPIIINTVAMDSKLYFIKEKRNHMCLFVIGSYKIPEHICLIKIICYQ